MKKILVLFGILDLVAVVNSFQTMSSIIEKGTQFYWLHLVLIVLYGSMIASGILLIRSNKAGTWIYYVQFPFRLIFYAGLSLGFLYPICNLFCDVKTINILLVSICSVFEVVRLVVNILIHIKI